MSSRVVEISNMDSFNVRQLFAGIDDSLLLNQFRIFSKFVSPLVKFMWNVADDLIS